MRSYGNIGIIAMAAMASVGVALPVAEEGRSPRKFSGNRPTGNDPRINRHTGEPHQHKREIARRLRQAARA